MGTNSSNRPLGLRLLTDSHLTLSGGIPAYTSAAPADRPFMLHTELGMHFDAARDVRVPVWVGFRETFTDNRALARHALTAATGVEWLANNWGSWRAEATVSVNWGNENPVHVGVGGRICGTLIRGVVTLCAGGEVDPSNGAYLFPITIGSDVAEDARRVLPEVAPSVVQSVARATFEDLLTRRDQQSAELRASITQARQELQAAHRARGENRRTQLTQVIAHVRQIAVTYEQRRVEMGQMMNNPPPIPPHLANQAFAILQETQGIAATLRQQTAALIRDTRRECNRGPRGGRVPFPADIVAPQPSQETGMR